MRNFYLYYLDKNGLEVLYMGQLQRDDGTFYHHFEINKPENAYHFPARYAAKKRRRTLEEDPKYEKHDIEIGEFTR